MFLVKTCKCPSVQNISNKNNLNYHNIVHLLRHLLLDVEVLDPLYSESRSSSDPADLGSFSFGFILNSESTQCPTFEKDIITQ